MLLITVALLSALVAEGRPAPELWPPSVSGLSSSTSLRATWRNMPDFNTIRVRLANSGGAALCIPEVDSKEDIKFRQDGREVSPLVEQNRGVMQWRGADLANGFVVVPPVRHIELYYTLTDWDLHAGPAEVEVRLPVYDCAEFFRASKPHARIFISREHFVVSRFRHLPE